MLSAASALGITSVMCSFLLQFIAASSPNQANITGSHNQLTGTSRSTLRYQPDHQCLHGRRGSSSVPNTTSRRQFEAYRDLILPDSADQSAGFVITEACFTVLRQSGQCVFSTRARAVLQQSAHQGRQFPAAFIGT